MTSHEPCGITDTRPTGSASGTVESAKTSECRVQSRSPSRDGCGLHCGPGCHTPAAASMAEGRADTAAGIGRTREWVLEAGRSSRSVSSTHGHKAFCVRAIRLSHPRLCFGSSASQQPIRPRRLVSPLSRPSPDVAVSRSHRALLELVFDGLTPDNTCT